MPQRRRHALPGFGLTLGLCLSYLGLIVLLPLAALALKAATLGPAEFWHAVTTPSVPQLTFWKPMRELAGSGWAG